MQKQRSIIRAGEICATSKQISMSQGKVIQTRMVWLASSQAKESTSVSTRVKRASQGMKFDLGPIRFLILNQQ
jgi:hypothetical protein